MYRDRLNLDLTHMQREVEEKFALLKQTVPIDRQAELMIRLPPTANLALSSYSSALYDSNGPMAAQIICAWSTPQ